MSSSFLGKRVVVFGLILLGTLATAARAADPKVVKASHEVAVDEVPAEAKNSNDGDLAYSPQFPKPPDTGAMILRLLVGTVVVLVLCVGTVWIGKPWLQKLQITGSGTASFHIEGSVAVGNRAMLYLVRVGDTQLIAGTDMTGLKSLIALPASFKDVLDQQVTEADPIVEPLTRPFDVRTVVRSDSKE